MSKPNTPQFPTIAVSITADRLIQNTEDAARRLERAETPEEIAFAYGHLGRCRKLLYGHIAALEEAAGRTRPIVRRF